MTRLEKVLCGLSVLFFVSGAVFVFAVPAVRFSGELCFCLAGVSLFMILLHRWSLNSHRGQTVWTAFCSIFTALVLLFLNVEGFLLYKGTQDHRALPADIVIVLGAGVNGETPSQILQSRIETAAAYLKAHPETKAILSGGKGAGETISEAEAMRRGLLSLGVDDSRLWLEEQSTSTAENFRFSKKVLEAHHLEITSVTAAVITSDFHVFRAHLLAEENGWKVIDVSAPTPPLLAVNYYVREFFALGKSILLDLEHTGRMAI